MVVVAGAAIGNSREVQLKPGWNEGARVYGGILGRPGLAKSAAAEKVAAPLFEVQKQLKEEYDDAVKKHKQAVADWEARAPANRGPKPEPPVLKRVIVSDTTVEALCVILAQNPRGVLLYRDELVGWARSFNQYRGGKGADRSFWLSCWSGQPVVVDRKTGG
jgi:hypothetical protein